MKLLVLAADYPRPDGTHKLMYIHVRNKYYVKQGLNVVVLNFSSSEDYEIDGIQVITQATYESMRVKYDIVVAHAANIRNHYRFLKKYEQDFAHIVFFFHGHEVMKWNETYPSYPYMEKHRVVRRVERAIYDEFKLWLWRRYYRKLLPKAQFVFVSNWMFGQFERNIRITKEELGSRFHIIHNSIGEVFETEKHNSQCQKDFDFITIRSSLDGAKYGVDIVMNMAKHNPNARFLLIGRGKYFEYNDKPQNVTWIDHTLSHSEMIRYLNCSRGAIMMTRLDAQGVMTCELAAMGMPVITSNIDVSQEFFVGIPNIRLVANEEPCVDVIKVLEEMERLAPYPEFDLCYAENTIVKEVELFRKLVG